MSPSLIERLIEKPRDLGFLVIIVLCLLLAIGAVNSEIDKRSVLQQAGGARKIDLPTVRTQISDGTLSSKKAQFYIKVPR